ncbi:hypothetical protein Tco_1536652, partial [Tanacetum coccineum]
HRYAISSLMDTAYWMSEHVAISLSASMSLALKVLISCFMDSNLLISMNLLRGGNKLACIKGSAGVAGAIVADVGAAGAVGVADDGVV